jgi:serine/threonine protein phosphatase PrpC
MTVSTILLRVTASNNSPLSQPLTPTGHGGANCSSYISKELPREISQALNQSVENTSVSTILSTAFNDVDNSIIRDVRKIFRSNLIWPMPRSERQKMINSKFQQKDVREVVLRAQSGSTALVLVIEDEFITVANVGDCRAGASIPLVHYNVQTRTHSIYISVLGRASQRGNEVDAEALSIDQNGHNEKERSRILNYHPASESEMLFAGGRLFGHISTTRCEFTRY